MTVSSDNSIPAPRSTTSNEIAMMISGRISGAMIRPLAMPLPANLCRVMARAAHMPRIVLNKAALMPTSSEFHAALCIVALLDRLENHLSVKPARGSLGVAESLNENTGSSRTGKYRIAT